MEFTIAIITKNRVNDLKKCLKSLYRQKQNNFVILIVDNDFQKTAWPLYKYFKSKNKRSITYYCEPAAGYTNARNCALKKCRTKYLGFIDDDCILDEHWTSNGLEAIKTYHSAYVVGRSEQIKCKNLFAEVERYIYVNWMPDYFDKNTYEISPLRIDTKNVIIDTCLLKKNKIKFDQRFNEYGGEDIDLGLELKQCNLKGYFVKDMLLYHKGKSSLNAFIRKAFAYGYNCYNLYNKWKYRNELIDWYNIDNYKFSLNYKKNLYELFGIKQDKRWKKVCYFFLIKLFNLFFLKGHFKKKRLVQNNRQSNPIKNGIKISAYN